MSLRFALLDTVQPDSKRRKVHRTDGDETRMTVCGQENASPVQRFSRRAVKQLRDLPDCKNCVNIVASRSKR